jgi:hypothetical protein
MRVEINRKWGLIDKSGNEILPVEYEYVMSFSEGLIEFILNGKRGFIDKNGNEVVPPTYDATDGLFEGLAAVNLNGKYGYIDKTGKEIVPLKYDGARFFSEGLAGVAVGKWYTDDGANDRFDGKWGFIAIDSPLETASEWARVEISSAIAKGFVPEDIQSNYTDVITRQEFCRMAVKFVEYKAGKNVDALLVEKNLSIDLNAFADTSNIDILAAFVLGITDGTKAPTATSLGQFLPNGIITRQQAARMLMNVCSVLGAQANDAPLSDYADIGSAAVWAVDAINFCYANGIMEGTGNSMFSPMATYDRQQSIVTFDRITLNQ